MHIALQRYIWFNGKLQWVAHFGVRVAIYGAYFRASFRTLGLHRKPAIPGSHGNGIYCTCEYYKPGVVLISR
jgi:hypothetical protein